MRTTSRTQLTTTAVAAALGLAGTAGAATASAKSFDLTTAKGANGGQAHGYGSVRFTAPKTVKVSGHVNDLCPKDGYGAYIEFKVNFVGGGYGTTVRKDTNTCKHAAVGFDFTKSFSRKVASVGVTVIELDNVNGSFRVGDAARVLLAR